MKAPKRFLMIYFLRTTAAAFANSRTSPYKTSRTTKTVLLRAYTSSSAGGSIANGHPSSSKPPLTSGHITFRLARSADVPQIQACNLATLPENYNDHFYMNHMRQWPELALVAEHIPHDSHAHDHVLDKQDRGGITPLREYMERATRGAVSSPHETPERQIVGYILGKVEQRPVLHPPAKTNQPPSKAAPLYDGPYDGTPPRWSKPSDSPTWETLGHVTSLAVHSHARRLGVASSLLRQLHYHLRECYSADAVGLHVRLSNAAAVKLYVETLGYDVADIIPGYYGDGEDAYFMRKELGPRDGMPAEMAQRSASSTKDRSTRRGHVVPDWVNRDTRSSFFDNRTSMRDTLSQEERAWIDSNRGASRISGGRESQSSFTGKVTRTFRTFLHGNETQRRFGNRNNLQTSDGWQNRPPWETGPEELRLPRYVKIVRPDHVARELENRESGRKRAVGRAGQKEEDDVPAAEEFDESRSVAASGTG
ncbi:hypothetical protein ACHAW6_003472 [Cyclotella cf. meneghiniana]